MLYGTLVEKCVSTPNSWSKYVRVVICVETCYGLQTIRTNVFDHNQIEKFETIPLGAQVQFSGYFSDTPAVKFFKLQTIDSSKFNECEKCFAPLQNPCSGCMNQPTERIIGVWNLVEHEKINDSFKLTLIQDENVLCRYIFPKSPFYKACIDLKVDDNVKLQGWRNEKRYTELSVLEKSI